MTRGVWVTEGIALLSLLVACGAPHPPKAAPAPPVATPAEAECVDALALALRALAEPLTLTVHATRRPGRAGEYQVELQRMLTEYQRLAGDRLVLRFVDVETAEQRAEAKAANLEETTFDDGTRGYAGIALSYRGQRDTLPRVTREMAPYLRRFLAARVRELWSQTHQRPTRIGVVQGRKGVRLSDPNLVAGDGTNGAPSLWTVIANAFPSYALEPVNLDRDIDAGYRGLIVTQPGEDLTDEQLRRVDDFLMRGERSLVVYAGAINLAAGDARLRATLDTHRLDRILGGYGVEPKRAAIFDWEGYLTLRATTQTGATIGFRHPSIIVARSEANDGQGAHFDASFSGTLAMGELAFPFPSPLVAHPEVQPGATFHVVATTSGRATVETTREVDLAFRRFSPWEVPPTPQQEHVIGLAVEGRLKSAFDGARGSVPARVLVISASQFTANPLARAGNRAAPGESADRSLQLLSEVYGKRYLVSTVLAFKTTLDWMRSDFVADCPTPGHPLSPAKLHDLPRNRPPQSLRQPPGPLRLEHARRAVREVGSCGDTPARPGVPSVSMGPSSRSIAALTCLLFAFGCTASSGGSSSGGGTGVAPSGACGTYGLAQCEALSRCSPATIADDYGDVSTCALRNAALCELALSGPGTSATGDSKTACASALATASCPDVLSHLVPACQPAPGGLEKGAPCNDAAQCKSTLCSSDWGSCGQCFDPPPTNAGDPCSTGCVLPMSCHGGMCLPPGDVGATCDVYGCKLGLRCIGGMCSQPRGPGAPCTGIECDEDHFVECNSTLGVCQMAYVVQPGGSRVGALGDTSAPPSFCVGDWGPMTCLPRLADGEACANKFSELPRNCLVPARCVNSVCTMPTACAP